MKSAATDVVAFTIVTGGATITADGWCGHSRNEPQQNPTNYGRYFRRSCGWFA